MTVWVLLFEVTDPYGISVCIQSSNLYSLKSRKVREEENYFKLIRLILFYNFGNFDLHQFAKGHCVRYFRIPKEFWITFLEGISIIQHKIEDALLIITQFFLKAFIFLVCVQVHGPICLNWDFKTISIIYCYLWAKSNHSNCSPGHNSLFNSKPDLNGFNVTETNKMD